MPDGEVVYVGRLLSRNLHSSDRKEGFFKYDEGYLLRQDAYPLDPIHLPLRPGNFEARRGEAGVHGVFDDSLPDAWGRTILAKRAGLDKSRLTSARLLAALKGSGLGRLLYMEKYPAKVRCVDQSIEFKQISAAIGEAGALEANIDTENKELKHILAGGSSAGGARPKVLVRMDDHLWLAKFSSIRDIAPALFVSLEQAGMLLAQGAGLKIPELKRVTVENREILLVRRFDVTTAGGPSAGAPCGGRNAIVSMRTLTGEEDPYLVSYANVAHVVRRISDHPDVDLESLFRWMLVNVLLQNTDDHLQNFSMLHTDSGWMLSPAYDITPNIYQESHILQINGKDGMFSREDLISEGRRFGLSAQKCRRLLEEVYGKLAVWEDVFEQCGVPGQHTQTLRESIKQKRKLAASPIS
ncbi:MAG: type II toxin-antitoxin system HipA family toxin [Deltaproteobacteria bacterium]|nr:type II toxin-antitoxin system HipA family toxin [Deltaproteobacteria bacterium]